MRGLRSVGRDLLSEALALNLYRGERFNRDDDLTYILMVCILYLP